MASGPRFSSDSEEARFYLEQAGQYEKAGELENALQECNVAIAIDPKLADAYMLRGNIFERLGKEEDAVRSYEKALKISPGLISAESRMQQMKPKPEVREVIGELVTIATYSHPMEADLAKARLESEGILTFVADAHTVTMNWLYSNAIGGVRLRVPELDAKRAIQILSQDARDRGPQGNDDLQSQCQNQCPRCGSMRTEYQEFEPRLLSLSWILRIPLLLPKRKMKCDDCGHGWKHEEGNESSHQK